MVGVQTPTGENISYAYDADGVRVSKTVNGVTTEYLVDKNLPYAQVLEELVNDGAIASYVYGLDLISQQRGNADSFYLVDGLGSTRGLTNAGGVVTDTYSYDAFGNSIASAGGTANNYRFAGEQFDPNLGDYYLRQRYYDSETGRFTRTDTYEGRKSEPITRHDYLYGNANPVTYTDPTGFFSAAEAQAAANIANILNEIQWSHGQQFFAMATGGGEPTPLQDGFLSLFGFGVALASVALVSKILSNSTALRSAVDKLIKQRKLNRLGTCDECAKQLRKELMKNKIPGRHIRLETRGLDGSKQKVQIFDDSVGELIAYEGAGYHEGIVINIAGQDTVFDNFHTEGKPLTQWLSDLVTRPGYEIIIAKDDPF